MRVHVRLLALFAGVIAHVPAVATVGAAPSATAPVNRSVLDPAAIATEVERDREAAPTIVNVRVYESPEVSADALRAALAVARDTFTAASVDVVWTICGPGECNTPPSPVERLVRLVRSRQGGRQDLHCLGEAMIDPRKGTGVLATVYLDRVVDVARHLDIDQPTLLGRTIAHEIGHLLLATNTHGASGLMRELWSREELLARRADDWVFRPVEAAAIRQRLAISRSGRPSQTL